MAKKTLQAAVDAAQTDDTVIALPGYYDEGFALEGGYTNRVLITKKITLKSKEKWGAHIVGAFDTAAKQYHSNEFRGTYEITALLGTINTMDGKFYTHLHMTAADETGRAVGGHLNRAVISATCEMIVTLIPGTVDRAFSEQVGLNLFKF